MSGSPNVPVGWYSESQFTKPRPDCPRPDYWNTRDIQASEVEVSLMVHGLIRGLQPDVVLETGTSRGFMTAQIAYALAQNGHGVVFTFEPDEQVLKEARSNWFWEDETGGGDFSGAIEAYNCGSMDEPWEGMEIDFAWHDSLLELREPEFEFYLPHYSDRAVVCFHDTAPHFGSWSDRLRTRLLSEGFQYLDMPTPRGCIVARRNP